MTETAIQWKPDPLRQALDLLGNYAQVRIMLKDGGTSSSHIQKAVESLEVEICNQITSLKGQVA